MLKSVMQIHGIETPLIGLAPMDGVTDAAYRFIQKKHGNPDLIFTEFTHVVGLYKAAQRLLLDFKFAPSERPVIAQVFGAEPEYFYHAAQMVAALGFDGIDINMGCPARSVTERGSGAALIRTPDLAKQIIRETRRGFTDYFNSRQFSNIPAEIVSLIESQKATDKHLDELADKFTLSVKTRIGFDKNIVTEWVNHLNEMELSWLTIHGRTLKQLYAGQADWDAIAQGVEISHCPTFANGDANSAASTVRLLKHTNARGVLIGRGSYGNPWIFRVKDQIKHLASEVKDVDPTLPELTEVIKEHAALHYQLKGERGFVTFRKNLGWYSKRLPELSHLTARLVRVNTPEEVVSILDEVS